MSYKIKKVEQLDKQAKVLQGQIEESIISFEKEHHVIVLPTIRDNKIIIGLGIDVGTL